eukprot:TRINITY_DN93623_c0_g1_i1.p1 TRINITY_DN93623_c0_g1~~TRINITY_DN93623_c0_g1_i1.p1  ORF type:complete len:560 (+),score=124.32 TRINITY_DN93623_c0_g1_i1:25-1680(+)
MANRGAFTALAALTTLVAASVTPVDVTTSSGPVRGLQTPSFSYFKGIPFAKPPVGDLRWAMAQTPTPWTEPLNATRFSNACPQQCTEPPLTCPDSQPDKVGYSEDCLYLNVWVPNGGLPARPDSLLPVLVWFHGGRFRQESGSEDLYRGDFLSNFTNHVYVSTNYRLGALGFLTHPTNPQVPPNLALWDQRLALKWVQDNIAAFGGNPKHVTIFGQSAGGDSVNFHMTTAASRGLFGAVVSHSMPAALGVKTTEQAALYADKLAECLDCEKAADRLACLRGKTADAIVECENHLKIFPLPHPLEHVMQWTPVIDGQDILDQPLYMFDKGEFADVPYMTGCLTEDALPFIWEFLANPVGPVEYVGAVGVVFGFNYTELIVKHYPPLPEKQDSRAQLTKLVTDYIFGCPQLRMATNVASWNAKRNSTNGAYFYNFTHPISIKGAWGPNYTFCEGHSCHGSELPIVFNLDGLGGYRLQSNEIVLSKQMAQFITGLFDTGRKNAVLPAFNSNVNWPPLSATQAQIIELSVDQLALNSEHLAAVCPMWDEVGYFHA